MITVGIDTAPLNNQSAFRGVGYYTENLIENLEKYDRNLMVISGNWKDFWKKVDIIHFPYFDFFFLTLPFFKKRKTVVTIHDCIPLIFPECFPAGIKGKLKFFFQKLSLKGVSAVITDSENSKKDIIRYLAVPEKKITRVYLAPASIFASIKSTSILYRIKEKYELPKRFVLYVGDVNYNKNLVGLIEAFGALREKDLWLVFVGKAFENEGLLEVQQIKGLIQKLSLANRIKILGYVPREDLVSIYNLALAYCQPSLYEGFGLQILEAMACGCPVVTSRVSSLPEVGGEAAIYIDPYRVSDIACGLRKVLRNKSLRDKIIKTGLKQLEKFSWDKTVQETVKVYEKVLEK